MLPPVIQSKPARRTHPLRTLPVPSRYCSPITGGPVDAYSAFRLWGQSSGTASSAADGRIYTKRLLSWHTVQRATLSRHRFLLSCFFQNSINRRESQPANFQNIPPAFRQFSTRPCALSSQQSGPEARRNPLGALSSRRNLTAGRDTLHTVCAQPLPGDPETRHRIPAAPAEAALFRASAPSVG